MKSFLQITADEIEKNHSDKPFLLRDLHPFIKKHQRSTSALSANIRALISRGSIEVSGKWRNPNGGGSFQIYRFIKKVEVNHQFVSQKSEEDNKLDRLNNITLEICHIFERINPAIKMIPL